MTDRPAKRCIAIIGGGISGLTAAHRLGELDSAVEVVLLEASNRLGGVLQTVRRDGFLIERSADNFITTLPAAVELCRRIGFADQLLETNESLRRALVVRTGKLYEVPQGFVLMAPKQLGPIATTPLLSLLGKLRVAWEYFVRPGGEQGDESVASFARRRLGREAFERLVEPLVGGIYTADAEKLSLAAALPQFREMERKHGGLIRAAHAEQATQPAARDDSGARYSMFAAPRDGMSSLVDAIAARLPTESIRLSTPVREIRRDGRWRLSLNDGAVLDCDGLVLATPAPECGRLLAAVDPALAELLAGIEQASSAVVALGYRREQIAGPLKGFGFVVPAAERRRILAGSFASLKFPGRAPDGSVLVRVFLGGALQPRLAEAPEEELIAIAREELSQLIGARGEPQLALTTRWPATMPQYHVGHLDRLSQIDARLQTLPGLALAGNAYRGVGIPQCIQSGERAAEQLLGADV